MKEQSTVLGITKSENRFRYTLTRLGEPFMGPLQKVWSVQVDHNTVAALCRMIDEAVENPTITPDRARAAIEVAGRGLYEELLPGHDPYVKELRDYLCKLQTPLVICTDAPDVYWELMYIEEIKQFIGLKYDIGRSLQTCYVPPSCAPSTDHVLLCLMIVNPNEDEPNLALPDTAQEAAQLQKWLKEKNVDCDYMQGKNATFESILDKFLHKKYDFIHFTGHIVFEKDKCALVLNGGKLFTADSIRKQVKGTPIVFLNGCWGGKAKEVTKPSEIVEGLTDAFLGAGAQLVVGSPFEVPEKGARVFAEKFYEYLLSGKNAGEAMRVARKYVMDKEEYGTVWACFIMYGDPCLCIEFKEDPLQKLLNELGLCKDNFEISSLQVVEHATEYGRPTGVIGTPHLFAAMVGGESSHLRARLQEQNVLPETLKLAFQYAFKAHSSTNSNPTEMGFSKNVKEILQNAWAMAQSVGRHKIMELDLVDSFVRKLGGETGKILHEIGVNIEALASDWKPITCIDSLGPADCTPEAWEILFYTIDIAWKSGSTVAGTPHLFAGMLRSEQGMLAKAFHKLGIDPVPIRKAFYTRSDFGKDKLPGAIISNIKCSESVIEILKLAQKNMLANGRNKVTDEDLLQAFVQQGGGQTGKLLRKQGLVMEALICKVFKDTGELDTSRFDDPARHIIDNALELARTKGHIMLGSRHLLYAMLTMENSELTKLLRHQGKEAKQLANLLDTSSLMPIGGSVTNISTMASNISPGLIRILCTAETLVKNEQGWQIGEAQLLQGFLSDIDGEVEQFLLKHGVRWQQSRTGRKSNDRHNISKSKWN